MLASGLNIPIHLPICGGCLYAVCYINILRLFILRLFILRLFILRLFILHYLRSTDMLPTSVRMASLPSELIGATGRRYRFMNILQERPHMGRVWTAS